MNDAPTAAKLAPARDASAGPFIAGLLLCVASLTVIANAAVAPSLPGLRDAFASTPHVNTLAPLVITLPSLGIVLTAGIGGWLCDRFGRRPVMLWALLLYGIAGVAACFAGSLWQVLASRLLLGIGIGGTMTSTMAMIGDLFEGTARVRVSSAQPVVMTGASVLMLLAGGLLGEWDWRYPFLVYGISLLLLPLAMAYLKEPARAVIAAGTAPVAFSVGPFLVIGISALLSMIMYYLMPTRLPFLLRELGVASPALAGIAVAVGALFMAICAAFYGRYGVRLKPADIYVMIFTLTAVGYAVVGFATSFTMVLVGAAIAGTGYGWLFPVNNIMLMERAAPPVRGRAAGFHTTMIFSGQFLSPLMTGPVADRAGEANTFLAFAAISAAIAAAFWLYGRRV